MQTVENLNGSGKSILVVNAIDTERDDICRLLEPAGYRCIGVDSLQGLEVALNESAGIAALIDLDTLAVNNRIIRDLARKYPGVCFLCTSSSRLHPELKDAISHHFFACLTKPVDPDELLYWLRCISENGPENRAPS